MVHGSHNSGCCIRSVAPWITVLSWHTVFTKRVIYYKFTFVWYSAKQGITHRPMSHVVHRALSLAARKTQTAEQLGCFAGHCLLWLLLLKLAAVVVCLLLLQNSLLTLLAFAPDSEAMSATRISLMASTSSFIYFFPAIVQDPQSSALFRLCMTRHSCRNVIPVSINVFYSDSRTDLKLWCDCCIKISAIWGCTRC